MTKRVVRRRQDGALVAPLLAVFVASMPGTGGAAELTVDTALEADQPKAYKPAFEEVAPDVTIRWVRDSTGIITAKLLAEKANPQADVVMGVAVTSLMLLQHEAMLMPYAPAGLEQVQPAMRDPNDPPEWVGMDIRASAICFNTVEAQNKDLPKPSSWADPTKPAYEGQIVMPNPASCGTGHLMVSAWLQTMGEEQGLQGHTAPEHRELHPFGLKALSPGRARRARDRALVRVPGQQDQGGRRAHR